jgi:Flp pilus assembly protein CpaB
MTKNHWKRMLGHPVVIAIAIAVFGVMAMLIVDPWNRPKVQTAEVNHKTTGDAAQAVGAKVTPTAPKSKLEPILPGPKPVEPANPAPR